MANTYQLISSNTVGSGGVASVTFSSIPATYTDLLVKVSVRGSAATVNQSYRMTFNGSSTANLTMKRLYGDGASAASDSGTTAEGVGATATSDTFSNDEFYIPNYASSNAKSFSVDNVGENNATTAYALLNAGLWNPSPQAAITSIVFTAVGVGGDLKQYSTFYLYGIKNS
jgi:hypothetical protein